MTTPRHSPAHSRALRAVEPIRVQLAIQGGGARLSLLLGAMQAIEAAEKGEGGERRIRVTRLAGTSAGALAAALLAVGRPIGDIRAGLLGHRSRLEMLLRLPSKAGMAWRAYRGRPIVDLEPIRQTLGTFFVTEPGSPSQRQLCFSDLINDDRYRPLVVVASDIVSGSTKIFSPENTPETKLLDALMASIAVPFLFQSFASSPSQSLLVDGGLCENLPIDPLLKTVEVDGPVLAVALVPPASTVSSAPTSGLQFAQSLLDTAIRHAVTRARQQIPDNQIIELPTDLETFDFKRGLSEGLDGLYSAARDQTRVKLAALPDSLNISVPAVVDQQGPRELEAVQEAISRVYASHFEGITYFQAEVRLTVRLGMPSRDEISLDGQPVRAPDTMWHRVDFWPGELSIGCLRMNVKLTAPEDNQAIAVRDIALVSPDGASIPHVALLARDPKGPTDRMFLFFPTPPLSPPGPKPTDGPFYQFRNHQSAPEAMSPLFKDGIDTLGVATIRASHNVPMVRIIVMVPNDMESVTCCEGRISSVGRSSEVAPDLSSARPGHAMSRQELTQLGLQVDPGYYPIGWVATDVPPNTRLAVTVRYPAGMERARRTGS